MRDVVRGAAWQAPGEKAEATANLARLRPERLLAMQPAEAAVVGWLVEFYAAHGEAPAHRVAHDHFARQSAADEVALLELASAQDLLVGASFEEALEREVERQAARRMRDTFQQALEIASKGLDLPGQGIVQGTEAAASHVFSDLQLPPPKDDRMPANMREGGALRVYEHRKAHQDEAFGVPTGYRVIDKLVGGTRKGSLYVHAGFQSHLKSTFLANQCVRAVVRGWNVVEFTTEMSAEDMVVLMVVIHSADPQFASRHPPLDARRALAGRLGDEEEAFFREVHDHLVGTDGHGSLRIIDSGQFTTLGSVMQRTAREHQKEPVDLVWIDYLTRIPLDPKYLRLDHSTGMNLTLQDAKRWAMQFNGGRGLAVATAFQVNREGFKRASQNGGRLDATHLAQFNAVEREADYITYTWYGEEQRQYHEVLLGFIKNRWGPVLFDPVPMYYDEESRLVYEQGGAGAPMSPREGSGDEVEL